MFDSFLGKRTRRDAECQKKAARTAARQDSRCKKSAAQQCCSPQSRTPRASAVLQKAAEDAPHAERRNEDAEGIACPLLAQAVLVHDRLLEYAPRRRDAGEQLRRRPCRQNVRPAILFWHTYPLPFSG